MTDTPLFGECGNRLGLRRSDGTYVSTHRGRTLTVPGILPKFKPLIKVEKPMPAATCEKCQRVTEVDKLLVDKVS